MSTKLHTDMLGQRIRFVEMPNKERSGKVGTIRNVYLADNGKPLYTIMLQDGTLLEADCNSFKICQTSMD